MKYIGCEQLRKTEQKLTWNAPAGLFPGHHQLPQTYLLDSSKPMFFAGALG